MSVLDQAVVPKGSTVLVSGVNGYLASHVADQFVKHGYKVRGTVRDLQKNAWMPKNFEDRYGPGNFELVNVTDVEADGAFDEAVKGKL